MTFSNLKVSGDKCDPVKKEVDDGITRLFPEILEHIFTFLDLRSKGRVNLVCKSWHEAGYRKAVWRGVEAKVRNPFSNSTLLYSLWRRGIRRLHILSVEYEIFAMNRLFPMIRQMDDLESLSFSGCYELDGELRVNGCPINVPPLKTLDFSFCRRITDSTISTVTAHWKNLEVLKLGGCYKLTNTSLGMIAWALSNLKVLDLRSVLLVSDNGFVHLTGVGSKGDKGTLQLEYLSLEDCPKLSNLTLEYISEGFKRLKYLNLSYCVGIDDEGMQYLGKLPCLSELNLKGCDVSDIGIALLSENGANYTALDLSFCERIADGALLHIAQNMYNLKSLSLSTCRITDTGLIWIANSSLKKLESLYVGQCHFITDKSMKAIASGLSNLKVIDLFGCTGITAYSYEVLRSSLRHLDIVNPRVRHQDP